MTIITSDRLNLALSVSLLSSHFFWLDQTRAVEDGGSGHQVLYFGHRAGLRALRSGNPLGGFPGVIAHDRQQ
jgi:hypothetical protein